MNWLAGVVLAVGLAALAAAMLADDAMRQGLIIITMIVFLLWIWTDERRPQ